MELAGEYPPRHRGSNKGIKEKRATAESGLRSQTVELLRRYPISGRYSPHQYEVTAKLGEDGGEQKDVKIFSKSRKLMKASIFVQGTGIKGDNTLVIPSKGQASFRDYFSSDPGTPVTPEELIKCLQVLDKVKAKLALTTPAVGPVVPTSR